MFILIFGVFSSPVSHEHSQHAHCAAVSHKTGSIHIYVLLTRYWLSCIFPITVLLLLKRVSDSMFGIFLIRKKETKRNKNCIHCSLFGIRLNFHEYVTTEKYKKTLKHILTLNKNYVTNTGIWIFSPSLNHILPIGEWGAAKRKEKCIWIFLFCVWVYACSKTFKQDQKIDDTQ